ncbi:MAG: helix-turn-helix domain-containing protein [Bacteroidales bacterium]
MDWYGMTDLAIAGELGERIKDTRKRKQFSQKDVAERSGLSAFTISQIETGKNTSLASLIAVMRVLRLLENFNSLVPELVISPLEIFRQQSKKRKR